MKYLNKIILILLLALIMVVTLVLAIYSFGIVGQEFLGQVQDNLHGNFSAAISFIVIFILSAWSLYPLFRRKTGTATISTTENGQVNISLRAMKKIIREVAYQEENIDVRNTNVDAREDGLYATLSISVKEEEDIPTLTGRLQHKIKARLRNITGANIASVEILIENVEGKKEKGKFGLTKSEEQMETEESESELDSESDIFQDDEVESEEEQPADEIEVEEEKTEDIPLEMNEKQDMGDDATDEKEVEDDAPPEMKITEEDSSEDENDLEADVDEKEAEEDRDDSSGFFS